jgi:hypothetical protein
MELFGKVYIVINVEREKGKEINIIYLCVNTWLVINGRKIEQK